MEWIFWIILIIFLFYRLVGKSGRNRYPTTPPLRRDEQLTGYHNRSNDADQPLAGPWNNHGGEDAPLADPWGKGQGQDVPLPDPRRRTRPQEVNPPGYEHHSPQRPETVRYRTGEDTSWDSIEEPRPRRVKPVINEDSLRYRVKAASPESPPKTMREEHVPATFTQPKQLDDVLTLERLFGSPNSIVAGIIMGEVLQRRGGRGRLRRPGQQ